MKGVVAMTIWRDIGFYMVIFLAGLQTIPKELNEAAALDGAGPWQRFRRITVPLLNPSIVLASVIGVIYGLQLFTQVYVMTARRRSSPGGPLGSTTSVVLFIVQSAFRPLEMGYASAAAMLLFLIIMMVTAIQLQVHRSESSSTDERRSRPAVIGVVALRAAVGRRGGHAGAADLDGAGVFKTLPEILKVPPTLLPEALRPRQLPHGARRHPVRALLLQQRDRRRRSRSPAC